MKKIIVFFVFVLIGIIIKAETIKEYRKDSTLSKVYNVHKGIFIGKYTSYYKDGHKKQAEGVFENNERIGEWCVWDTSGQLRMKRVYENQYNFSVVEVYNEKGESILDEGYHYSKEKNSDIYSYNQFADSAVWLSRNIWRKIPIKTENLVLFDQIQKCFDNGAIKYLSDDLKVEFNDSISDQPIIAYNIKEQVIYDKYKRFLEFQIIAIAPSTESGDLFWLNYKDLRPYLTKIDIRDHKEHVTTLDDLLFFHHFESELYKESNIYNREIKEYKSGADIEKEANKIVAGIFDMEHSAWLIEAGVIPQSWKSRNKQMQHPGK